MAPKKVEPMKDIGVVSKKIFEIDAKAHFAKGNGLLEKGKYRDAIPHFERVLKIDPHHTEALYGMSRALYMDGKYPEAIRHLKKAIETAKDKNVLAKLEEHRKKVNSAIDNPPSSC